MSSTVHLQKKILVGDDGSVKSPAAVDLVDITEAVMWFHVLGSMALSPSTDTVLRGNGRPPVLGASLAGGGDTATALWRDPVACSQYS